MQVFNDSSKIAFVLFLLFSNTLWSQVIPPLAIGEAAQPLTVHAWLAGEPVTEFEKGKVYVMDFASVGCAPCRKAIPHLSQLATQYANEVKIVNVYVRDSEKKDITNLRYADRTEKLVRSLEDKIKFSVALDVPGQTTADAWAIHSTPYIYVVDKRGAIAWSGTSANALDTILPQVLADTLNAAVARSVQKNYEQSLWRVLHLKDRGDYQKAEKIVDSLLNRHPEFTPTLLDYKFKVLVGDDDARAYDLLRWMLTQKLEGFVWDKLVSKTWVDPKTVNYELALATADRAFREGENAGIKSLVLMEKAEIFRRRSWSTGEPLVYRDSAVQTIKEAYAWSKLTGDSTFVQRVSDMYYHYRFYALLGDHDKQANRLLRQVFKNKLIQDGWTSILLDALTKQNKPDYKLLSNITDWLIEEARRVKNISSLIYASGWKAKVYAASGKKKQAIALYEEVITLSKQNDFSLTALYQERLEQLKQSKK